MFSHNLHTACLDDKLLVVMFSKSLQPFSGGVILRIFLKKDSYGGSFLMFTFPDCRTTHREKAFSFLCSVRFEERVKTSGSTKKVHSIK